jgi:hypothetical protein
MLFSQVKHMRQIGGWKRLGSCNIGQDVKMSAVPKDAVQCDSASRSAI